MLIDDTKLKTAEIKKFITENYPYDIKMMSDAILDKDTPIKGGVKDA